MPNVVRLERWSKLINAVSRLSGAQTIDELVNALRESARTIAGSDGITVIRREGDKVAYIAEDAISPLWTGQSFPIHKCISGIAILEQAPVLIPDIMKDPRVPHEAYLTTFVKSMAMFPIGIGQPVMAMGAYWRTAGPINPEAVSLMTSLARSAGAAFENVQVLQRAYAERDRLRQA
jgi:GAF domain-containing protein